MSLEHRGLVLPLICSRLVAVCIPGLAEMLAQAPVGEYTDAVNADGWSRFDSMRLPSLLCGMPASGTVSYLPCTNPTCLSEQVLFCLEPASHWCMKLPAMVAVCLCGCGTCLLAKRGLSCMERGICCLADRGLSCLGHGICLSANRGKGQQTTCSFGNKGLS